MTAWLLALLALIVAWAGIEDARTREIANWKNAAIVLLAPLWWWSNALAIWPDIVLQIGVAALVLGCFAAAFQFGWMGGGDVKMIAALALWFPLQPLAWLLIVMSLAGGGLTLLFVIDRALRRGTRAIEIPYGVAIAFAALISIREPIFNTFV